MRLKPVHDKIIVKPISNKKDEVTEAGIILPDTAVKGKLLEGEVVAVGQGMYSAQAVIIPPVVSEGDTILYSKHAATQDYSIDGEDYILMSINEVMSIVREK